jgi:hypothetical protein
VAKGQGVPHVLLGLAGYVDELDVDQGLQILDGPLVTLIATVLMDA